MIVIVDIDGTICDSSKRLDEVGFDPKKPASEWPTDWGDHSKDEPIPEMVELVNLFFSMHHIWLVTVREDAIAYEDTKNWLEEHDIAYSRLFMVGDSTRKDVPPAELKREWLNSLSFDFREDILLAMEDSPSMIKMFREEDIRVLDVGQFKGSM